MKYISKFSLKLFFFITALVVLPLGLVNIFCRNRLEEILQKELSNSVIQNVSRNQSYINDSLMDMAYYSNVFVNDDELRQRLATEQYSSYDNTLYFNHILSRTMLENPTYIRNNAKIILFDNYGRVYSNWSLNYRDYKFILEEDWVKNSKEKQGYVSWSLFQPSYIEEEKNEKYISLARTVMENKTEGKEIGTLIISIGQDEVNELIMQYAYEDDQAYICIENGDILLATKENTIEEKVMKEIYHETEEIRSGKLKRNINNKEYLISYSTFPSPWKFGEQEMKLFHFTDYSPIQERIYSAMRDINIVIYCALFLMIILSFFMSRKFVAPVIKLTRKMKEYSFEKEIVGLDLKRNDEIGSLNRGFVQMNNRIQKLLAQLKEENEIKEKYHYESLRAQLNPHFLFNTLNTIRWMAVIRKADNIVESIDAIGNILKYSMSREDKLVSLEEEIQNIHDYIYIHSLRYAEIIDLEVKIENRFLQYKTLKFILQPIVENAVIHGVDGLEQNLKILIDAEQKENVLYLSVKDNGVGIAKDAIEQFECEKHQKKKVSRLTGIGLTNVDAYIRIRFGEQYGLRLQRVEEGGTEIIFRLPVIPIEKDG